MLQRARSRFSSLFGIEHHALSVDGLGKTGLHGSIQTHEVKLEQRRNEFIHAYRKPRKVTSAASQVDITTRTIVATRTGTKEDQALEIVFLRKGTYAA